MVSLDYSLGIQIVNFLLLIFILNVLLYKPILGMIDRRKKQLEESESEIKRLQESVEQKMVAYEEKLRQAKAAAVEQKNEIIGQGAEEAKTVIDAVRAELPGIMEHFRVQMDGEIAAARKILIDQSQNLSVEIAEKVLGRSLR
ncbi:MAG: ATP synthase F0 subunit B [Proteobacteria bacterium]|nr:ATP synthase F0 subunit B [Pseudomonadota bacterium]MCG2740171.1 ATP synthase F0 subunit B [Syntrophaceae bacterium]MBU1745437.1 ATP synthase F0 subunit B [Pseudomonadota bacterium]MBU1965589.1 ATP synthase F0 subunit B [Pseudomonadota bacterium]MBU4371574.1 ATP synthase F0 subunit B [Pseudomonadota bacterium]